MKKIVVFFLVFLLCISCKRTLYNLGLKKIGAYDESIVLSKVENQLKEVVFIPMVHVSTPLFYKDAKHKIDSLKTKGYFFYTEGTKTDKKEDTILRKIRKIRRLPFSKSGYASIMDSVFGENFKYKKEIVSQFSYAELGLDSLNSKNVDVTLKEMVNFYEKNYGAIVLEPCDFEVEITEMPKCKDKAMSKEVKQALVIDFRNTNVVNELVNDTIHTKIAIIYGRNHIVGMKEQLRNHGFE